MNDYQNLLSVTGGFIVIALASKQIGQFFLRAHLPLISGFLFAGIIAGPFILGLIPHGATENLRFVDEFSLAFIAFAAGSELYLSELKSRYKSITWIALGNVLLVPLLGGLSILLLAEYIPFLQGLPTTHRIAVALLGGAILIARSPSSAIAIVNELRAKGPFTQTILGVTMITDIAVIVLFAINSSIADALIANASLNLSFILLLLGELLLSVIIGYVLGRLLHLVLALRLRNLLKTIIILLLGYGVFVLSSTVRQVTHEHWPFEIFLEPLLICLIGSFWVTNYSRYRTEFLQIIHDTGPPIYIAFFTLTGASLALDVMISILPIAIAIFIVRILAIFISSFGGGLVARDPLSHNRLSWMTYITQAGVGLGLAKEAAAEFPEFGAAFAAMIISVIVVSQIAGPPFFKWAITRIGEAHRRADTPEFDGVRDAIIFGLETQSLALARQLQAHGWEVKIASRKAAQRVDLDNADVKIFPIADLTLDALHQLDAEHAEVIITMLSDDENYHICELAYEHIGTEHIVVRLNDRAHIERFRELGALIVDPSTATISLIEQFVRSPSTASLLLGMESEQDIIEIELLNPVLNGIMLRNLRLPLDTLVLSLHRDNRQLISHGYTQLRVGDRITIVGSPHSLEEVVLRFTT